MDFGRDEVDALLNADDPGIEKMSEREEQQFRSLMAKGAEILGHDRLEELIFQMVAASEERLRVQGTRAANYCLEWLDEKRAR